jgi:hypothetical protein
LQDVERALRSAEGGDDAAVDLLDGHLPAHAKVAQHGLRVLRSELRQRGARRAFSLGALVRRLGALDEGDQRVELVSQLLVHEQVQLRVQLLGEELRGGAALGAHERRVV